MRIKIERNTKSNRNGTNKINSITETPTKINVSFDFYRVSDVPHRGALVHIYFRIELGVRLLEQV